MAGVITRESTKEEQTKLVNKTLDFLEKHRVFVKKTHERVIAYAKEHCMPPHDLLLLEESLHQTTLTSIHVALESFFEAQGVQWKQKQTKDTKTKETVDYIG